jgi:dCTP deaminase
MSIKSDKWIRRMAEQQGMIEPFELHQVKEVDGRRVVSYGTSSYGYDVRCAAEFKLFTNVYSAIVDPKKFDSKSFVDIKGEHVVIPPNSFALARTVEILSHTAQRHDDLSGQEHLREVLLTECRKK